MKRKIRKILKATRKIFEEVSYPNGAITASSSRDIDFPSEVKSYDFVWLRDASFVCVASDLLGMHRIPRKFFDWVWDHAEGIKDCIFYHKYFPNGRAAGDWDKSLKTSDLKDKKMINLTKTFLKVKLFYSQFQPDEVGSLLWAIHEHSKFQNVKKWDEMIRKLADCICKLWSKDHFRLPSYDLWEERVALPRLKQSHTYSVAMCKKGLECAVDLIGKKQEWENCLNQMKKVLEKAYDVKRKCFVRTIGKKVDRRIDSSLLGLVWPSESFSPRDERILRTVKRIEEKCVKDGGVYRYPRDKYTGRISGHDLILGKTGAWPVLNFWLSIYYSLAGRREKAREYFDWVLERVKEKIPEQIVEDKPSSILPLSWSHAMFVISGKFLKLI